MQNDSALLQRLQEEILNGVKRMNTVGFLPSIGVYEIVKYWENGFIPDWDRLVWRKICKQDLAINKRENV